MPWVLFAPRAHAGHLRSPWGRVEGGSGLRSWSSQWPVPLRGWPGISEQTAMGVWSKGLYNHGLLQRKKEGPNLRQRCAQLLSRVRLFVTLWTAAHQALLSMGFSQARILERVAIPSARGSPRSRDWTWVSYDPCSGRRNLYHWATWGREVVSP